MSIENKIFKKIGEIFDEIDYNDLEKKDLIYFLEQKDLMLSFLQQRIDKAIDYIENDMFEDYCVTHKDSEQRLLSILKGVDKE